MEDLVGKRLRRAIWVLAELLVDRDRPWLFAWLRFVRAVDDLSVGVSGRKSWVVPLRPPHPVDVPVDRELVRDLHGCGGVRGGVSIFRAR